MRSANPLALGREPSAGKSVRVYDRIRLFLDVAGAGVPGVLIAGFWNYHLVGGTFFVYYWGLSLTFDLGFWGYRLGWYAGQVPT